MKNTKQEISDLVGYTTDQLLSLGFTIKEIANADCILKVYYQPSDSMEYYDGENFYNINGVKLKNPLEYDESSEGYTPFGDE